MIGFSLHIQQLLHRNLGLSPQRYYHRVAPNSSGQGGKVGKYRGQMTNLPLLRPRFAYQAYHELEQPCIKKQILRVSILWTWHLPTCLLAMPPLLPAGETPAMAFQRNFHRKPWDCGTTSHAFLQFVFPKSMKCGYCNLNISQSHPMSHSPSTPINSHQLLPSESHEITICWWSNHVKPQSLSLQSTLTGQSRHISSRSGSASPRSRARCHWRQAAFLSLPIGRHSNVSLSWG